MNLPLWIAARYLRTHRQSGLITLLTGISIGGVALGVSALLTVLAVMNGFENEIQTRIAGTDAHVVLLGETAAGVVDPETIAARVAAQPGVAGVAPFTYTKAMVFREGVTEGLVVKGVDLAREHAVTTIAQHMTPALDSIPVGGNGRDPGIVLGSELAIRLGAGAIAGSRGWPSRGLDPCDDARAPERSLPKAMRVCLMRLTSSGRMARSGATL